MGRIEFDMKAGKNFLQKIILSNKDKGLSTAELNQRLCGALESLVFVSELKIKDLQIELKKTTVHVSAIAKTQEDRDLTVLLLGNIQGIEIVHENIKISHPATGSKFHQVLQGESLSHLAESYYKDPLKFDILFQANKLLIRDPNSINPGILIRIPEIDHLMH